MDSAMMKWALGELEKAYPSPDNLTRQAVTAMLNVWGRMTLFVGTQHAKINREEALDVFTTLARGQTLGAETKPESGAEGEPDIARSWWPAKTYGSMSRVARVRSDYDTSVDGWKLNGRVGTVVDLRDGRMAVDFFDVVAGAPGHLRGTVADFEVDLSHLEKK